MPELPEVETVVRQIRPQIVGKTIAGSKFLVPRQLLPESPKELSRHIDNQQITAVRRRGKYILVELQHGILLVHLRMTGKLYTRSFGKKEYPHERALFELKGEKKVLVFHDTRTLGTIRYFKNETVIAPIVDLGWEPLEDKVTVKQIQNKLALRKSAIKPVLLDQTVWAGIGNIYASEALWESQINPAKPANKLTQMDCEKLLTAIPKVLKRALKKGGSTLKDFVSPDGKTGAYQNEFCVYSREHDPCLKCKTPIKKIVQAQRSTYFCPYCQKK